MKVVFKGSLNRLDKRGNNYTCFHLQGIKINYVELNWKQEIPDAPAWGLIPAETIG